jgi:hypothetical protein
LLAAGTARKKESPEANAAFTAVRNELEQYSRRTTINQKLFSAFMGVATKDRATTSAIEAVEKMSSPPVSVLAL